MTQKKDQQWSAAIVIKPRGKLLLNSDSDFTAMQHESDDPIVPVDSLQVGLPGDYGFDPLGLSDPEGTGGFIEPRWLAYGEIINVLADPVNNNVLTSLKFH
ncbi:predicted protein [Arabidopsis lyrata subsp. lyrata]|uniref:Predicted protein n=1 Tax=Arabidopsis lyrata subsp. lyrata TaxID=81972 RepID=D7KPY7_ARALL|nr:predicted protein [Arabidopsis lyrata subsp. lyrata]